MSGYVEAGYVIVLSTLFLYAVSVVVRERAARRRLGENERATSPLGQDTGADE